MPEGPDLFPNKLRELRLGSFLTRVQLAEKTVILAQDEPDNFNSVSVRSLERIERGETKPRIKAAAALAKVLDVDPKKAFPLGPDDGIRNREGKTNIPEGRRPRGKARK